MSNSTALGRCPGTLVAIEGKVYASCACGAVSHRGFKLEMPEDGISKILNRHGWEIDNRCRRARCPACAGNVQRSEDETMEQSPDALRKQRQMYNLIDEHFDAKRGAYAPGWDDARISKETGLSVPSVTRAREAVAGPIRVDPVIEEAMNSLGRARKELEDEIAAVKELIASAEKSAGEKLDAIGTKLAQAQAQRLRAVA